MKPFRRRMAPQADQQHASTSGCNIKKPPGDIYVPRVLFDPIQSRQYCLVNFLGKGAYGRCYEVKETAESSYGNGTNLALKVISKSALKDHVQIEKIHKEVAIHRSLDHDNVIKLLSFFEDSTNVYMVLELGVHGTLLSNIQTSMTGHLSELVARSYMREIVAAVVYIHEVAGILHRDLKPGNILIGLKNRIKLADFGLAVRVSELPRVSRALSGTPNYMSPEVLDGNGHSKESEAWALGCVFYCMLVGKPPFETDSLERTYSRIRSCSYFIPPEDRISERARVLIHRLLDPDVGRRLKVVDILDCDYFSREKAVNATYAATLPANASISFVLGHDASMACSYQAGVHSRESGMDLDRMRSPKPDEPMLLLNLFMSGQISVLDEPSRVVNEHIVMVNKWVDYTNTYGFGCVLSDGTECVQFVDGSSCAHRFATRYTAERWQLVINTNERPPTVYEWTSVSDVSDPVVIRKIELANLFSAYMHRELQSASPFAVVMPYMNYLVYQRRSNGALVMVLSDGITQINLLETHEKLVLRFEESGEVSVVVVHPEREMRIYRVSTKAFVPTAVDNRCVHDLITEARCRLVDHSNRPYYATEC